MNASDSGASGLSRLGRALSRSMKSLIGAEKEEALVQVEMDSRSTNRNLKPREWVFVAWNLQVFLLTRKISKVEIDLGGNESVEKRAPRTEAGARNVRK